MSLYFQPFSSVTCIYWRGTTSIFSSFRRSCVETRNHGPSNGCLHSTYFMQDRNSSLAKMQESLHLEIHLSALNERMDRLWFGNASKTVNSPLAVERTLINLIIHNPEALGFSPTFNILQFLNVVVAVISSHVHFDTSLLAKFELCNQQSKCSAKYKYTTISLNTTKLRQRCVRVNR